jgi:predicted NAD/FAD-binding protein
MGTEKIAIIGGGVAGIGAAYRLQDRFDVTLFEKNSYLGGHTHTFYLPDGPDQGTPIDTGFIVHNNWNYPTLLSFFKELNIQTQDSDMSLSVYSKKDDLYYSSDIPGGLFAQRKNLLSPRFYRMLSDIFRFFKEAKKELEASEEAIDLTLGDFLKSGRYSRDFIDHHLVPMAAAIWSSPLMDIFDFPLMAFLRFYRNHGLLNIVNKPQWKTVVRGSNEYIKIFKELFKGRICLNSPVKAVLREEDQVKVRSETEERSFDKVVVAAHADEAFQMLGDPSDEEKRLLGAWKYSLNDVVLHTDPAVMPPSRRAWASWNVSVAGRETHGRPVAVTYYMNRLQRLNTEKEYFVSLNQTGEIAPETVITDIKCYHPVYTFETMKTQKDLPGLNGKRNTYFCGSYFRYGFHEDAIRSGYEAAGEILKRS